MKIYWTRVKMRSVRVHIGGMMCGVRPHGYVITCGVRSAHICYNAWSESAWMYYHIICDVQVHIYYDVQCTSALLYDVQCASARIFFDYFLHVI